MQVFLKDRFSISKRGYTKEGYMIVEANRIARCGILQYRAVELGLTDRDPLDTVRIYRPPDVLLNDTSIQSFNSKPVTLRHPPQLLTSETVKQFQVGFSKDDAVAQHPYIAVSLVIQDEKAVNAVEQGEEELSAGYDAEINFEEGVTPTEEGAEQYDAVMLSIEGNHIAIVSRGRCGRSCKVSDAPKHEPQNERPNMELVAIVLDGISHDVTPTGKQIIDKLNAKLADAEQSVEAFIAEHKTAMEVKDGEHQAAVDQLQANVDAAKKLVVSDADLDTRLEERGELIETTTRLMDSSFDPKGKSNQDIKRECVSACSKVDITDKDENYVNAYFDSLKDHAPEKKESAQTVQTVQNVMTDHAEKVKRTVVVDSSSSLTPSAKKREASMAANRKRWNGVA